MRLPRRRAQHELPSYDGGPTAKRQPVFAAVCEAVFGPSRRSLSERSGHSASRADRTGFMSTRPNDLNTRSFFARQLHIH
jgi:hypothetical protein